MTDEEKDDRKEFNLTWLPGEWLVFTPTGPVPLDEFCAEPAADEPAVVEDKPEDSR